MILYRNGTTSVPIVKVYGCEIISRGYLGAMLQEMGARTEPDSVQINLRVPRDVLDELDAWIEEINTGRRVKRLSKNSVVLSLIAWGLLHRPAWAGSDPPANATVPATPREYPRHEPPQLQVTEAAPGPAPGDRIVELDEALATRKPRGKSAR